MSVKVNGLLSSLRMVWSDVMPLSHGVSFTTQELLEDRVSELERENQALREQLERLGGWSARWTGQDVRPAGFEWRLPRRAVDARPTEAGLLTTRSWGAFALATRRQGMGGELASAAEIESDFSWTAGDGRLVACARSSAG